MRLTREDLARELIIDIFAGGGGASEGIEKGIGRPVDIAVNHDPEAIAMHKANHPHTQHFTEDVWRWNFRKAIGTRRVGLLWASPDCTQHSRAKGGKPIKKKIRSLAWIIPRIISGLPPAQRPRILHLENVVEFADWGPVVPRWRCADCRWSGTEGQMRLAEGRRHRRVCAHCDSAAVAVEKDKEGQDVLMADPARKGITFRRFLGKLKALGYDRIERRTIDAADLGTPTHRKRLFLIARRDGHPIIWSERTHGPQEKVEAQAQLFVALKPYRQIADCLDWSLSVPSIFITREAAKAQGYIVQRPLAEKTEQRIAHGVKRFVIDTDTPYLAPIEATLEDGIIVPHLMPITHHGFRPGQSVGQPGPTITAAHRGEHALVATSLVRYNGEKGDGAHVHSAESPIPTIPGDNRFGMIGVAMVQSGYGERDDQHPRLINPRGPGNTAVDGVKAAVVAAFLAKHNGGHWTPGQPVTQPIDTIMGRDQKAVVAAHLVHMNNGGAHSSCDAPGRTVMAGGNHAALVYAFLTRYFGTGVGRPLDLPGGTVTGRDRDGLVYVIAYGHRFQIADIGMRMLVPRELFLGNGFRPTYILTGSKTSQVKRCGNSVCPPVPESLTRDNYFVGIN
jgi:DNA (cytosine-5)-methyltransferase 1